MDYSSRVTSNLMWVLIGLNAIYTIAAVVQALGWRPFP